MNKPDMITTVEPLLVSVFMIQNPSTNEVTKIQAIEAVRGLIPQKMFVEEDSEGNLLFDNRPIKKRDTPVPTIVAHLDQVHDYARGFRLALLGDKMVAYNHVGKRVGTGGDDKCGVYVAIKMLMSDIPCRVILTQDEEVGCVGAQEVSVDWGQLSSILLQADRRGNNDLIFSTNGNTIADKDLIARVLELPECAGMKPEWGSVTDVGDLCEVFNVSGFNISAGYYNAHCYNEHVMLPELATTLARVMAISRMVGSVVVPYPVQTFNRYGNYGANTVKHPVSDVGSAREPYMYDSREDDGYEWDDDIPLIEGGTYVTRGGIVVGPMTELGKARHGSAQRFTCHDPDVIREMMAHLVEEDEVAPPNAIVWWYDGECIGYPDFDIVSTIEAAVDEAQSEFELGAMSELDAALDRSLDIDDPIATHYKGHKLPPLPSGFKHWAWRGRGWKSEGIVTFVSKDPNDPEARDVPVTAQTVGVAEFNYFQAI